jgi:hypothetical protein
MVPWLIPSVAGLLALAIVLAVLRSEYRAKPPILVPTSSGRLLPFGAVGAPSTLWHARIIGPEPQSGSADGIGPEPQPGSADGILTISKGTLAFRRESEYKPAWQFPVPDLMATQRGPGRGKHADVELQLPDGRQLDVIVSKSKIKHHGPRVFHALAEGDQAHVLVSLLAANGAECRRQ